MSELGLEEIDLSKSESEGYGSYKLKAVTNIKANINEILYIFNHPDTRVFWQTHIADIKIQEGDETIVTYEYQGKRLKEKFTTTIYKEHDNIYVVDHNNLSVIRIFEICYNTSENNHVVRFYSSTQTLNLSKLQPQYQSSKFIIDTESPSLLVGLNSYLAELIADSDSRLYTDYHFKGGDKVLLRNSTFEIQKNYLNKQSFDESDPNVEVDSDHEQKLLRSRTKSRELGKIEEQKIEEDIKVNEDTEGDEKAENYKKILQPIFDKIEKVCELSPENKWEKIEEKEGNIIHFKDDPINQCFYVRSEANIRAPIEKIMKCFEDYEIRRNFDDLLEKGNRYETLSDNITLEHMYFKGMLTVSGRDFVIASQRKFDEQGNLTVVAQSIEDPRVPVEKKYVRGEIKMAGYLMKYHPNDRGLVNIIVLACTDLKGSIPRTFLTKVGKKQGLTVLGLRKYLEKQK